MAFSADVYETLLKITFCYKPPPPPKSDLLAAFTMASTFSFVISPCHMASLLSELPVHVGPFDSVQRKELKPHTEL